MNAYANFIFVISFEYQNLKDLVSWNSFKVNWTYLCLWTIVIYVNYQYYQYWISIM